MEDEEICKKEAEKRGISYLGTQIEAGHPKGCHAKKKEAWFNQHAVGSQHSSSSPICIYGKINYALFPAIKQIKIKL